MKKQIRKNMLTNLSLISSEKRQSNSIAITNRLQKLVQNFDVILSFVSFGCEVDTSMINQYILSSRKKLLIPRIESPSDWALYERLSNDDHSDLDYSNSKTIDSKLQGIAFLKNMVFHIVDDINENSFEKNSFGILEPKKNTSHMTFREIWESNPLVIVPGLAFTENGNRLGYGGGFYDRFLSIRNVYGNSTEKNGLVVGICHPEQLVTNLPIDLFDKKVDYVITNMHEVI